MTRVHTLLGTIVTLLVTSAIPALAQAINSPAPNQVFRAGPDYASDVLHDPWDFSNVEDIGPFPDDYLNWVESPAARLSGPAVFLSGGKFRATSTTSDPGVGLLFDGIANTVIPGRSGQRYPIDASRYNRLAFKMKIVTAQSGSQPSLNWFTGMRGTGGIGSAVSLITTAGERIYQIDLRGPHSGVAFQGAITGLRLDPISEANVGVEVEWVRLTAGDTVPGAGMMPVQVSNCSAPRDVDVLDGTLTTRVLSDTGTSSSFNYGIFPPGNYVLRVSCGNGTTSAPFTINAPPRVTVLQPSERGSMDYATTVRGNPWDFADPSHPEIDVPAAGNVVPIFDTPPGLLHARSTGPGRGDPGLYFLFGEGAARPIATSRYRYATFSLGLAAAFDLGVDGSVARFVWASTPAGFDGYAATTTSPILVWPGMNTYTFDLAALSQSGNTLEPCWPPTPQRPTPECFPWTARSARYFRFDPHEISTHDADFYMGPVTLTAPAEVVQGGTFPIQWNIADDGPAGGSTYSVRIQYAPELSPNSRTTIVQPLTAAVGAGQYSWQQIGLAPGSYVIYVEASETRAGMSGAEVRGALSTGVLRVIGAANNPVVTLSQPAGSIAYAPFTLSGCAYNAATGAAADEVLVYAHALQGQWGGAVVRLGRETQGGLGTQVAAPCSIGGQGFLISNIVGLPPGLWRFRVLARNTVTGDFDEVSADNVMVEWGPPPAQNLRLAAVSGNTVTLAWDTPAGSAVTAYRIEAAGSPSFSGFGHVLVPGNRTSITGTLGNGTYYVRLVGRNGAGYDGPPSNVIGFTLPGGALLPPGPIALSGRLTSNPVTLTWSQSGGGPATYYLHAGTRSGASDVAIIPMGSSTGLPPVVVPLGVSIFARIVAVNGAGASTSNEVVVHVPAPGPPGGPPVMLDPIVSGRDVTLRWNAPLNSPTPTSYVVLARLLGSSAVIATLPHVTATALTIPNAPPGDFVVTVVAMYGSSPGAESNAKTVIVR